MVFIYHSTKPECDTKLIQCGEPYKKKESRRKGYKNYSRSFKIPGNRCLRRRTINTVLFWGFDARAGAGLKGLSWKWMVKPPSTNYHPCCIEYADWLSCGGLPFPTPNKQVSRVENQSVLGSMELPLSAKISSLLWFELEVPVTL